MIKRKTRRKIKNKRKIKLILIGSLMILITLGFFSYKYLNLYLIQDKEKKSVKYYLDKVTDKIIDDNKQDDIQENNDNLFNYVAVVEIPKIKLVRGLVDKNDSLNNVNHNIQILKESTMPNVEHSNLYLAAHSGDSSVSYFKYLDRLIYDDEVYIYYQNIKYIYKVVKLYEIDKNGYAEIKRSGGTKHLILVTCIDGTEKQLVIICDLKEERQNNEI